MAENAAIVKFAGRGAAPVLSANVPEPTAYSAYHVIELKLDSGAFIRHPSDDIYPPEQLNLELVRKAMRDGFADPRLFPSLGHPQLQFKLVEQQDKMPLGEIFFYVGLTVRVQATISYYTYNGLSERMQKITPELVLSELLARRRLRIFKNGSEWDAEFVPIVPFVPTLALIEFYRLSSFLGAYGAGRTIKTFSLLPGEKTKLTVRSYTKSTTRSKAAESILDSYSDTAEKTLADATKEENADRDSSSLTQKWDISASAGINMGVGSASLSASYGGSASSSREQSVKAVKESTRKTASNASNNRSISISQDSEVSSETGDEEGVERELQNINVGRTLNFVFRQMNQEFITLLHLVDVRVAFQGLVGAGLTIVPLSGLADLLASRMVPERVEEVKQAILRQLRSIYDYQDQRVSVIEERIFADEGGEKRGYIRFRRDLESSYDDGRNKIRVPGVILSADTHVMRTDGVIVEALLGEGDGLDAYSHGLQDEAVEARKLANDLLAAQIERERALQGFLRDGDQARLELWSRVTPNR